MRWRQQRSVHRYSHGHTCVAIDSPGCWFARARSNREKDRKKERERKYTDADMEEKRSCRSWLLLVPPGTRAEMDSGSKEREVRRCRARGRRPASSRWTRRRLGKRERERSKEESAWRALSDREAEEKMSDLFSLSLFPAFYPRSSSFGPLLLSSLRPLSEGRGKERERERD